MAANAPGPQPLPPNGAAPADATNPEAPLPQNDGARSFADLQRIGSPRLSHAVDIKIPERKPATTLKSTLNPMSPAYKPGNGVLQDSNNIERPSAPESVKDRVPTPLSPLHQLRPAAAATANQAVNGSNDTLSPSKKSNHLHSSSISSFETADFFPRNTREYSTRQYAYPDDPDEDKENVSPVLLTKEDGGPGHARDGNQTDANLVPEKSKTRMSTTGDYGAPAPPPGTPGHRSTSIPKAELPIQVNNVSLDQQAPALEPANVPDRQADNLSPKVRRQDFLFVEENPSQYGSQPSSSSEKYKTCPEEVGAPSSPADNLDFSEASSEWIEGYRAGLARKPVASDCMGDFLDGYCAGLLKSKPSKIGPSTGSPVKSASRRPSPGVMQSRSSTRLQHLDRREPSSARPPFESQVQSMDTLKEAVFDPQNENAILTPAPDGPHVTERAFDLCTRVRRQELAASADTFANTRGDGTSGFPFSDRTASMIMRQGVMLEGNDLDQHPRTESNITPAPISVASELSANPIPHSLVSSTSDLQAGNNDNRMTSMTSIDSNIYRQWPGHRVFSNQLEWKSATSVAQAAGLASGFFANVQMDGAYQRLLSHKQSFADVRTSTGAPPTQRPASIGGNPVVQSHSRFKEGSLDGITNPPNSPQLVSPPVSPAPQTPPKDSPSADKKKASPTKANSPAKAKFENLAEKVGIKVAAAKKEEGGSSPNSPPGKRRWRDVWRGARKDGSEDKTTFVPYS